jgi:hypothetical protein
LKTAGLTERSGQPLFFVAIQVHNAVVGLKSVSVIDYPETDSEISATE